ncbi:pentatricopeptide repeat-containing protein At5g48910-like [Typha angustifolia]|uniref:pentatricopeptide repeat-containing protein At5g48910-like n=1 Tax=Typha angustifolia TaxID=59011 RepID=UPI003C309B35
MVEKYGISQQIEHYGCMVDLLGRGGLLNEAYSFIEKMPVKANSVILSALLRACRIHRNAKIGQLAQEHLLKLDPVYEECLLLSNLFSEDKKRDYAKEVRRIINYQRKCRPTFYSYIEWNGTVQQFSANDTCHAQAKEINVMLEEMSRRLGFSVYDNVTEQIKYDVCKEENGTIPSCHSEMVALAFGLINLDSATPIKIVTNHRMSSDCHSSFKLLSRIYNRVITVRDGIRFHQMEHGSCSRMDYW